VRPSSLAGGSFGWALLVVAMSGCGLSAQGQGALSQADGASSGGDYGGSSSGTGGPASSASSGSSGGNIDGDASDDGDDPDALAFPLPDDGAAGSDAPRPDAAPRDAQADGPSECAKLNACCPLLTAYGSSAMSVAECNATAATGNDDACDTILEPLEGLFLCP
jgi:hypothetical protein